MKYDLYSHKNIRLSPLSLLLLLIGVTISLYILLSDNHIYKLIPLWIFVYCIIAGLKEKFIINPYLLLSLLPLSLLVYDSKISDRYLVELNTSTIILFSINIMVLLITIKFTKPSRRTYLRDYISKHDLIKHTWIMFFIGNIPFIYRSILSRDIIFASIFALFSYAAIVMSIKSKNKQLILFISGFHLIKLLLNLDKLGLLFFIIVILVALERYFSLSKRDKLRFFLLLILSGGLLIMTFHYRDYLRSGGDFFSYISGGIFDYNNTSYFLSSETNWKFPSQLFMPYLYFTTPLTNLQFIIETQNVRTYGLWILKPIIGYLQLDSMLVDKYSLVSYSSFNTFTYISVFFKDFGYLGSLLGSFLTGFYIKKIYTQLFLSKSPLLTVVYGFVAVATLQMFFSNHFFQLAYPFTILIIMYLYSFFASVKLE